MKLKDLDEERGRITSTFIAVDTAISMIIAKHYLGNSSSQEVDFLLNVLGNDQCTFAFKRNVFIHILRVDNLNESYMEEINRLNNLRNTFAHRQHVTFDNPQTQESEIYFTNPKFPLDRSKNISAEDLKKEFDSLWPDVINWLYNMGLAKGIPLPSVSKQDALNTPTGTHGEVQV